VGDSSIDLSLPAKGPLRLLQIEAARLAVFDEA
jgi:hypothetical protein